MKIRGGAPWEISRMAENDFTQDCLHSVTDIKEVPHLRDRFCRQCRNATCHWAEMSDSLFEKRVTTQVDRFIDNPKIADETHPRYFQVREIDFPDMMREAILLEASDINQDWEIPSIADSVKLVLGASEASRTKQIDDAVRALALARGSEAPPVPEPQKDQEIEVGKIPEVEESLPAGAFFSIQVPSETVGGKSYQVILDEVGRAQKCSCKAGQFNKNCRHLRDAERMIQAGGRVKTPPSPAPEAPKPPPPEFMGETSGARTTLFPVSQMNTSAPQQGQFIGGRPDPAPVAPEVDPWAPVQEQIVEVGSTLTIGKK